MNAIDYKAYLYLEDNLIPVVRISVSTGIGEPASANITIPPSSWAERIAPGTRVMIFLQENGKDKMFLWFMGTVSAFPMIGIGNGDKSINLACVSDFASLTKVPITGTNISSVAMGALNGETKILSASGSVQMPVSHETIGMVQMWGPLLNTKQIGSVTTSLLNPLTEDDQPNEDVSVRGKIFAILQTILLSNSLTRDELRRSKYLDRLAIYVDENASQMLLNQGVEGTIFNKNVVYQLFQGTKTGWQILNEYLGLVFHEIVSVAPPLRAEFDVPHRSEMMLPVGVAKYLYKEKDSNPSLTLKDYMSLYRNQSSIMECLIKPDMTGTFPPSCNVIQPDQYNYFNYTRPVGVTRMAVQIPQSPGLTSVVLQPPELEEAFSTSLEYAKGSGKASDAQVWNMSDTVVHRGNDYVTNEERITNHIQFVAIQMNPLSQYTLARNIFDGVFPTPKQRNDIYAPLIDKYVKFMYEALTSDVVSVGYTDSEMLTSLRSRGLAYGDAEYIVNEIKTQVNSIIDEQKKNAASISKEAAKDEVDTAYLASAAKKIYDGKIEQLITKLTVQAAKKEQPVVAPGKQSLSQNYLTAWRQEATRMFDRSREGQLSITGSFNLKAQPGFSILFVDSNTNRDLVGYLRRKTDTLDFSSGAAVTQYDITNAELLTDLDFSRPTLDGGFLYKTFGSHRFSWGKPFDYSTRIYRKFLHDCAYIPESHLGVISNIESLFLQNKVSSNSALPAKRLTSFDETLAFVGLRYNTQTVKDTPPGGIAIANSDPPIKLYPDDLPIQDILDSRTKTAPIYVRDVVESPFKENTLPSAYDVFKFHEQNGTKERFYVLGDFVSLWLESELYPQFNKIIAALDSRVGNIMYMYDILGSSKSVSNSDSTVVSASADKDTLIKTNIGALRTLVGAEKFDEFLQQIWSCLDGDFADLAYNQLGWDFVPVSPRWAGNPGLAATDLLISYLSAFENKLNYSQIHNKLPIGTSKVIDNVSLSKANLKAFIDKVYGTKSSDIKSTLDDIRDEIINKLVDQAERSILGINAYSAKNTSPSYAYLIGQAIATQDSTNLKQALRRSLDANTVLKGDPPQELDLIADVVTSQIMADANKFRKALDCVWTTEQAKYINNNLRGIENKIPPVPRPLTEQQVVAFRRKISDNIAQELSYYARVPQSIR